MASRSAMAAPPPPTPAWRAFFASAPAVYGAAAALRAALLVYGLWQDAHAPVKYTDIDYLVFTDAARFVAHEGPARSPYARETYRYTPLLAWLLLPTAAGAPGAAAGWGGQLLFASGKVLFAAADLLAGWFLEQVVAEQRGAGVGGEGAALPDPAVPRLYASVWLLNPMVAAISTRGSAEGLLGALVAALLWAALVARRPALAGALLGAGVHLKIYPFVYAPALFWWLPGGRGGRGQAQGALRPLAQLFTPDRLRLALASLATFAGLNAVMYAIYGFPFVQHTFLHHLARIDHRHNFSPYNTQLYRSSASPSPSALPIESLAFAPQLLLAAVLLPLVLARRDLPATLLAQTFAFVAFNKVCTSQYFLWYLVLLPAYLPRSSLVARPRRGLLALALWVAAQAAWLHQGYALEFLGRSTFVPGLWLAALAFFLVNCWILGVIVDDVGRL